MNLSTRRNTVKLWLLCLVLARPVASQNPADKLPDAIPVNAIKRGPFANRERLQTYDYYSPQVDGTQGELIARETYKHEVLVKRVLLQGGKQHGMQSEWYPNGQLKSAMPYRAGIMDGTFRHWDKQGHLVGQYTMSNGTGVRKIYNSFGILVDEEPYANNLRNGQFMEYSEHGRVRSLLTYKGGEIVGKGYDFYDDQEVSSLTFFTDTGKSHGPMLEFDRAHHTDITKPGGDDQPEAAPKSWWVNGTQATEAAYSTGMAKGLGFFAVYEKGVMKAWYVKDRPVTEAAYAQSAAQDPTLPPYYADAMKYKELIPATVTALLEHYANLPKVKIPLEFDAQGNPVLAQ